MKKTNRLTYFINIKSIRQLNCIYTSHTNQNEIQSVLHVISNMYLDTYEHQDSYKI